MSVMKCIYLCITADQSGIPFQIYKSILFTIEDTLIKKLVKVVLDSPAYVQKVTIF